MAKLLEKLTTRIETNLEENRPIPKGYIELLELLLKQY